MLKILVFVVFTFVGVKESTSSSLNTEWTEGSTLDITVGPEDALYCKLVNNRRSTVYDGFGPCRVTLDRVTMNDEGLWQIWYGTPGSPVSLEDNYLYVNVVADTAKTSTRITSSVERNESTVILKCSVPEELAVVSCTFRDPFGHIFIASPDQREDSSYKSHAERNSCTLQLLRPENERQGIWRCGINTAQDSRYSFIHVDGYILVPGTENNFYGPLFEPKFTRITATEGEVLNTLFCSIDATIRYCYYRSPNGTVINISPSTSSADYEYIGNGFDAGECGLRIKNVRPVDHGQWSCNVGLNNSFVEQTGNIDVFVNNRTMVEHRWQDSKVVVRLRLFPGSAWPELEYCRFVRSDGLGFTNQDVPPQYIFESYGMYGACELGIPKPEAVDIRPWTVIAKILGEDKEVSVTTTIQNRPPSTSVFFTTTAIILWSFFGTFFIFLIVMSFMPKKNREWTSQRVARIRNSFRRQPPHPQSNVTSVPNHQTTQPDVPPQIRTDILTDLPPKF